MACGPLYADDERMVELRKQREFHLDKLRDVVRYMDLPVGASEENEALWGLIKEYFM